jgi:hypothetical protein
MAGQCADRGGHAIVGAAVQVREIPADSFTAGAVEFTVIGTAVRASGCPPLARPFATDLSGPDFAKRSDACRAHPGGTDHFAEAVITGTAVARFAERRTSARPPSLAVLPLG